MLLENSYEWVKSKRKSQVHACDGCIRHRASIYSHDNFERNLYSVANCFVFTHV